MNKAEIEIVDFIRTKMSNDAILGMVKNYSFPTGTFDLVQKSFSTKLLPGPKKVSSRNNAVSTSPFMDDICTFIHSNPGVQMSGLAKHFSKLSENQIRLITKKLIAAGKIFMGGNRRLACYAKTQAVANAASNNLRPQGSVTQLVEC